jgi:hypothetical protein
MKELLAILGLYLLGAALVTTGAAVLFGLGVALIVVGGFSLIGAYQLARGIARVPAG